MSYSDIEKISAMAAKKKNIAEKNPKNYLFRSIVAGFYIIVATILSYTMGAILNPKYPELAKIMVAACFATAIVLIYMLQAELFTGNNLVMAMGVYDKKTNWLDALRVWGFNYIGNFIGCFILAFILVYCGSNKEILNDYFTPLIDKKLHIPAMEMFLRGILCNFMVCITVVIGVKVKEEISKIVLMFLVITAFVIGGFEHSVANMGIFSIGFFQQGALPAALVAKSMFFVTLGNIVGGAIVLGLPLKLMSVKE
ncbi:formate/nitrite transporter family protein [Anaerosporobacter faecicola]|uniref:formate/nitrite transporter family protein n=1 Tax=Anaerosporobacter faecicola TaxID=2718714 RepID=UPI00143B7A73|nr:formate/nitrite transporter family protein [Anaerosporobacter faecicola]